MQAPILTVQIGMGENILILAFVIFLLVKQANKLIRKREEAPAGPSEIDLLIEIRDELKKR